MRTRRPAILRRGVFRIVPLVRAGRQRDVLASAASVRAPRPLQITALTVTFTLLAVACLLATAAAASSGRTSFHAPARLHTLGIGIVTGGSSSAAGVGDAKMKSPLGTTGRLGPFTSGADGRVLPPMAGDGDGVIVRPPLGATAPTRATRSQGGECSNPCNVGFLSSVSCASATSCTAVGVALNNLPLAERWNGTSWNIEPTPNPAGSAYTHLDGVSCTSATTCIAVGAWYTGFGGYEVPLAEFWNGSTWTIRAPPSPSDALSASLSYVQCASASACMAVGGYYSSSRGQGLPLAEFWDGTGWTIQSAPVPSGANGAALDGVSCPSSTTCTAVGAYAPTSGPEDTLTLAESWDGSTWSIQPPPNTPGSGNDALTAVWCESATSCIATGGPTGVESWNGTSWAVQSTPSPGLANVSCAPAGAPCKAVGSSNSEPLAESWDGTNWSIDSTPAPDGSPNARLSDVSCTSPTACTAVGSYFNPSAAGDLGVFLTLAERWDGAKWTIQSTPDPPLVLTGAATNTTTSSVTLTGSVNPNGATVTNCYFEYGPTDTYGSTMPCAQSVGAGTSPVVVSANLSGLTPSTTYHFALVATNAGGTARQDPGSSFTTSAGGGGSGGGGGAGGGGGGVSIADQPIQQVVFVHGIRSACDVPGNANLSAEEQSYVRLYAQLHQSGRGVYTFCYDHDLAFKQDDHPEWDHGLCFSST